MSRRPSTEGPLTRLLRRSRGQRSAIIDVAVIGVLSVITAWALVRTDLSERLNQFTRQHESWNLDEVVLITLVILGVYVPVFAVRRWMESTRRLREANTDVLTGLHNRRQGRDMLELEIARAERYRRPLSVVLFDIDHFKAFNDRHGHLVGDKVLRVVAKTVRKQLRQVDTFSRWGGEEFLVISAETDRAGALQLAEKLRRAIEERHFEGGIFVTASFGTAQLQRSDDADRLFRRADERLHRAKAMGRNRVL